MKISVRAHKRGKSRVRKHKRKIKKKVKLIRHEKEITFDKETKEPILPYSGLQFTDEPVTDISGLNIMSKKEKRKELAKGTYDVDTLFSSLGLTVIPDEDDQPKSRKKFKPQLPSTEFKIEPKSRWWHSERMHRLNKEIAILDPIKDADKIIEKEKLIEESQEEWLK